MARLDVMEGRLCVAAAGNFAMGSAADVWLLTQEDQRWIGRRYGRLAPGERCVAIPTESGGELPRPRPANTGVMLTVDNDGRSAVSRTSVAMIWWPSREAALGEPIAYYPQARSFWQEPPGR